MNVAMEWTKLLFDIQHKAFQILSFRMIDVDRMVGWLVQLMQYPHATLCLSRRCEDSSAEIFFSDSL